MPFPAARLTDLTQHGGMIIPPTAVFTMIEMLPAARLGDMHVCPMVTGLVPHVGGPIILASFNVFIEMRPAARVMDQLISVGPPDLIAKGAVKTIIGEGGASMSTIAPPAPDMSPPGAPAMPGIPGAAPGLPASGGALAPVEKATLEGDPVDVATGRMVTSVEEFVTQGGPEVRFRRFYGTSSAGERGAFGHGWWHSLEERIEVGNPFLAYHDGQGRRILFPPIPPGEFVFHLDEQVLLRREEERFVLEVSPRKALVFGLDGGGMVARLSGVRDDAGRAVALEYEAGLLRLIADPQGNEYRLEYADGRHVSAIQFRAAGTAIPTRVARYEYDPAGNLVSAADALGFATRYQYDEAHRMVRKTDRCGNAFAFQYDGRNRCARAWGQGGLFDQTFEYADAEPRTVVRDSAGRETAYTYNDLGMVTRVVDAAGGERLFEYEGANLVAHTDALGRRAEYRYDPRAHVISTLRPGGGESAASYSPDGSCETTDAEGGTIVVMHRDGRVQAGLADAPPLLSAETDLETGALRLVDGLGNTTTLDYDAADRVSRVTQPLGQATRFDYDARGNLAAATDGTGAAVRFAYDAVGRLTRVERDGGGGFQFQYDGEGNLTHFVDGCGRATEYRREGYRRLTAVTAPTGAITRFDYDEANRLRRLVDGRGAETQFEYDALGRPHRTVLPDGRCEYFTFDPAGQLARFLDRGGVGADCEYDLDGNRTAVRCADGTALDLAYDKAGRMTRPACGDSEVLLAWDGLGRLVAETQDGATVAYAYDEAGRLASITDPTGEAARFAYDANGRLATVTLPDGGEHRFAYSDAGPMAAHRFPNGLVERVTLNRLGLPVETALVREGGRPLVTRGYRYDGNDCVTEVTDSLLGRTSYRYDAGGRIVEARRAEAAESEAFAFDASSNLTAVAGRSGLTYDRCCQLQGGPGLRCRHDARGNVVLLEMDGAGATRFRWDGLGRLVEAALPDGSVAEYAYDAFGRRVRKSHGGRTTRYLWAGDQLLAETTVDGASRPETRRYVFLPGTFEPLSMSVDGAAYHFHTDHRGAPVRASDAEGAIVWAADYAAFGAARVRAARIEQALRLPGQQYDAETGLHYNRARYYHPALGRYLTPDPAGFAGGLNTYVYADNDPVNQSDPLGRAPHAPRHASLGARTGAGAKRAAQDAGSPPLPPGGDLTPVNPTPAGPPTASDLLGDPPPPPGPPSGAAGCPAMNTPAGSGADDVRGSVCGEALGDAAVPTKSHDL